MISKDSSTAISSPASAAGPTPLSLPDGQPIAKSGQAVVPASRGAWREKVKVPTIRATFGQRGFHSSRSADLSQSLESRLRERMASTGSILFSHKWKQLTTPSGRAISLLRVHRAATDDEVARQPDHFHHGVGCGLAGGPVEVISETVPGSLSTKPCLNMGREPFDTRSPHGWIPRGCGRCDTCVAREAAYKEWTEKSTYRKWADDARYSS